MVGERQGGDVGLLAELYRPRVDPLLACVIVLAKRLVANCLFVCPAICRAAWPAAWLPACLGCVAVCLATELPGC